MIKRYEECIGLSFPALCRFKLEIWFCFSGYSIRKHTHPDLDICLIFLFGHNTTFYRERGPTKVNKTMKWWNVGRRFTILNGDAHYFTVSRWPLLFLNVERWYKEPTSAAESLKLV